MKFFCHRQYSQTKSFVGVAIGLLEEEGKFRLDDKIIEYLDNFRSLGIPMSTARLQRRTDLHTPTRRLWRGQAKGKCFYSYKSLINILET